MEYMILSVFLIILTFIFYFQVWVPYRLELCHTNLTLIQLELMQRVVNDDISITYNEYYECKNLIEIINRYVENYSTLRFLVSRVFTRNKDHLPDAIRVIAGNDNLNDIRERAILQAIKYMVNSSLLIQLWTLIYKLLDFFTLKRFTSKLSNACVNIMIADISMFKNDYKRV